MIQADERLQKPRTAQIKSLDDCELPDVDLDFQQQRWEMIEFAMREPDSIRRFKLMNDAAKVLAESGYWNLAGDLVDELAMQYEGKFATLRYDVIRTAARNHEEAEEFDATAFIFEVLSILKRESKDLRSAEKRQLLSTADKVAREFDLTALRRMIAQAAERTDKQYRQEAGILVD